MLFPNIRGINQELWLIYRSVAYRAISEFVCIIIDPFHLVRQRTWIFNRERHSCMKSKETKIKVEGCISRERNVLCNVKSKTSEDLNQIANSLLRFAKRQNSMNLLKHLEQLILGK